MSTRNKRIIIEIVQALGDLVTSPHEARKRLERHYAHSLLVVAGTTEDVSTKGTSWRMALTEHECGKVLDYYAKHQLAEMNDDLLAEVTGKLYPHAFVEPEK